MNHRPFCLLLSISVTLGAVLGGCTRVVDESRVYSASDAAANSSLSSAAPSSSSSQSSQQPSSSQPVTPSSSQSSQESSSQSAQSSQVSSTYVPAMSADYARLEGLSTKSQGWGPGNQRDERGRPYGSTAFQDQYGQYCAYFIAPDSPKVYLTFDEGYEAEGRYTVPILDTLKEKDCKAVFFVTGDYVRRNADLVQRMIDEGHIVGSHSWSHPSMPGESVEDAAAELTQLHDYVKENFDYDMTLFRFPMGEFSEQTLALVQDMGYQSVFWSFAYQDWEVDNQMAPADALAKIQQCAHPGAIFLLHAVSSTNANILGQLIDWLREEGYEVSPYDLPYFARE